MRADRQLQHAVRESLKVAEDRPGVTACRRTWKAHSEAAIGRHLAHCPRLGTYPDGALARFSGPLCTAVTTKTATTAKSARSYRRL